jgi:selenocysteine lyase/cysteine desulfurase
MDNDDKKDAVYLDTACLGMVSKRVVKKIRTYLSDIENASLSATQATLKMYGSLMKAREAAAKLLKVSQEEIAVVESTTHGLGLIANSIPLERNNNVLVCDVEFMAAALCWRARQEIVGFEIRRVNTKKGEIQMSDFEAAVDKNTRAIVISSVQEVNGFRADTKPLAQLAKKYGCYLIIDGVQESGVLDVNLSELDVDVYCSGGHKWLRNPFGAGFMYVNKKILGVLEPSYYGYFNALDPPGGWENYVESPLRTPFDRLEMTNTAQKFEIGGTGNYIGALGLYENIMLILEYGIKKIEKKVKELNAYLVRKLTDLNLKITSPINPTFRSGITTFSLPGGLEQERKLAAELEKNKIFISIRYTSGIGGIRISPHYYNSQEDIDRFLELTENFIKK